MRFFIAVLILFSLVFSNTTDSLKSIVSSSTGKIKFEKSIELADLLYGENDSLAKRYIDEAISFAVSNEEPIILMKARFVMGDIYYHNGNYRQAGDEYKNSLILAEKHNKTDYLFENCRQLGAVFYNLSDYKTATIFYYKSLELARTLNDEIKEADVLSDFGIVWDEIKDFDKALDYYNQSLTIYQKKQDLLNVAKVYNNIAISLNNKKEFDKALENFERALKIYRASNNLTNQAVILNNMASIQIDKKQYNKAIDYLNQSNKIFIKNSDTYGLALNNHNYGKAYFFKKNYVLAGNYLNKSIKVAEKMGVSVLVRDNYAYKAKVDSARTDFKAAYDNFQKYLKVNNQILEDSKQREIYEVMAKYELSQKEKQNFSLIRDNEIKRLELDKQRQINNFFIIVFVLLIGVSYLAYRSFILKSRNEELLKNYSDEIGKHNRKLLAEIEKTKNELNESNEKLRQTEKEAARMDKLVSLGTMVAGITHEIKNPTQVIKLSMDNIRLCLNDLAVFIYELIKLNKGGKKSSGDIKTLIEKHKVTKLFNDIKSLVVSNKKSVDLIDQIVTSTTKISHFNRDTTDNLLNDIISDVLVIIKNSIKYSAHIDLELDHDLPMFKCNYQEMAQILINLLTNARDAITERENVNSEGLIKIESGFDMNNIFIQVSDNGVGMSKEHIEKAFEAFYTTKATGSGQGLGLSIVKSIVDIYGGFITINSVLGEGTTFRINFPYQKAAAEKTEENKDNECGVTENA